MLSTKVACQRTNLVKFHLSSRKSEILDFDGLFLSKSYKVSTKQIQKSYLWWHWRVMQRLKKNCLFVSNMTWEICHSPNHSIVRKFHFGYFCPKYMRFEVKKYRWVFFNDTEQWCKIWINLDLVVSKMAKWHKEFG